MNKDSSLVVESRGGNNTFKMRQHLLQWMVSKKFFIQPLQIQPASGNRSRGIIALVHAGFNELS
jgi:hypothetical protein